MLKIETAGHPIHIQHFAGKIKPLLGSTFKGG